jgi:hypothetical protein
MTALRVVRWRVEDAGTGETLHPGVLTESYAEVLCDKLKRKHPAAFVKRVDP